MNGRGGEPTTVQQQQGKGGGGGGYGLLELSGNGNGHEGGRGSNLCVLLSGLCSRRSIPLPIVVWTELVCCVSDRRLLLHHGFARPANP